MRHVSGFTRIAILLALGACKPLDQPVVDIPPGSDVFRLDPSLLAYSYVDTSTGLDYRLQWLAGEPFAGHNCIGLLPRSASDTIGTFVFVFSGANQGLLERYQSGVVDTTVGSLLFGNEGTHGSYALSSTGTLNLIWADGTRSRFFDPSAVIRLSGDTIYSDVDLRFKGDSLRIRWAVRWRRNAC